MALITLHDTQDGIDRLMKCMFDIEAHQPWFKVDKRHDEANVEFQKLFDAYRQLIQQAYVEAEPWWAGTIDAAQETGMSGDDAIAASFNKRMAGPASYPKVIWIVRVIWLACDNSNMKMPDDEKVRPEALLLQWLIDAGETELVRLIACMPYWPIGMDKNGRWC